MNNTTTIKIPPPLESQLPPSQLPAAPPVSPSGVAATPLPKTPLLSSLTQSIKTLGRTKVQPMGPPQVGSKYRNTLNNLVYTAVHKVEVYMFENASHFLRLS
jgi:hypothetical protein